MKNIIKKSVYFIAGFLPNRIFIPLHFFYETRKIVHLNNPKTFSEKIQWLKLFGGLGKFSQYVDKLTVRDYVKKRIGEKYLIPLIGTWNTFNDIPFDKLPKRYALKATHGSGFNFICKDNALLDKNAVKKIVSGWLKKNYYSLYREIQYKKLVPRIICEEYIEDESGELMDYKFFCFHGKAKLIQIDSDRYIEHKRDIFDIKWNKLPITLAHPNSKKDLKKPGKLQRMLELAEKLSKDFLFVRVDLYIAQNKIYFGELTFTPGNGMEKFSPSISDSRIGELLDLSQVRNSKSMN